jgi:hypothetical protein
MRAPTRCVPEDTDDHPRPGPLDDPLLPPPAYWTARAAGLATLNQDGIQAQAAAWGLGEARCFESTHKMPFPIEDTQAYAMAGDRMIVTGFRGTEVTKIYDCAAIATALGAGLRSAPWDAPRNHPTAGRRRRHIRTPAYASSAHAPSPTTNAMTEKVTLSEEPGTSTSWWAVSS